MDGDKDMTTFVDVGPGAFSDAARTVIAWQGENFYRLPRWTPVVAIKLLRRLTARES